jgi:hypothetical protein
VTRIISLIMINLILPKAIARHEPSVQHASLVASRLYFSDGTAHPYVRQKLAYRRQLWKARKRVFKVKYVQFKKVIFCFNLSAVSQNTFLLFKTSVFAINWINWHNKLQYLFSYALYNQWQLKKCVAPMYQHSRTTWGTLMMNNIFSHSLLSFEGKRWVN